MPLRYQIEREGTWWIVRYLQSRRLYMHIRTRRDQHVTAPSLAAYPQSSCSSTV